MFFWLRELAGWGLVLIALYLIRIGLIYVSDMQNPRIVEAAVIMLTSLGVLRAGVLLIRISTATRILHADGSSPKKAR
jgi:hypothetical protein